MSINDSSQEKSRFLAFKTGRMLMLTDIPFWADNEKLLDEWCKQNNCVRKGLTVEALDDNAFTMFLLRWA